MSVSAAAVKTFRAPVWWAWLLPCLALVLSLAGALVQAYDFEGSAVSVAVLESGSTSGEPLAIGRSGVTDSSLLIGLAPVTSTLTATGVSASSTTLRGSVSDMNGLPTASGYFRWGYSAGALSSNTASQTVPSTGTYTTSLSGYTAGSTIYYEFVCEADGAGVGGVESFNSPAASSSPAQGGVSVVYRMTVLTVFMWLAVAILSIWGLSAVGVPVVWAAIVGAIIAYIAPIGAQIILQALLQYNPIALLEKRGKSVV